MESPNHPDLMNDDERVLATASLVDAKKNPVLSSDQSRALAQVHALLAIEQRLAQLCASLDAVLVALAAPLRAGDLSLAPAATTTRS